MVTGTPVRGDFFRYTRQEAREKLGLADDRPLLLSYWGSLGAEVMNRRMVDFLSGAAYAQEGKVKKVAVATYIITPYNVDIIGDLIDELENNGLYF